MPHRHELHPENDAMRLACAARLAARYAVTPTPPLDYCSDSVDTPYCNAFRLECKDNYITVLSDSAQWTIQLGNTACPMDVFPSSTDGRGFYPIKSIVDCFDFIFTTNAREFIRNTTDTFGVYVKALIVLGIIVFGIRIMWGGMQLNAEAGILFIKMAIIGTIVVNPVLIETWFGYFKLGAREFAGTIMNGVLSDDAIFVLPGGGTANFACKGGALDDDVFAKLDCLLIETLGIGDTGDGLMGEVTDQNVDFIPYAAAVFGKLFLGGGGAVVAFVGLWALLMFFLAVTQATYLYLSAIIAIGFLAALTPLILPLWFFKVFQRLVGSWMTFIMMYSLQVIILFAFLALTLTVFSMASERLSDLHDAARAASEGTVGKRTTTLFDSGSIEVDPDRVSSFIDRLNELGAFEYSHAPIGGETSYIDYRSASTGSGIKTAVNLDPGAINEMFDVKMRVRMLDWGPENDRIFIAVNIAYFFLLYLMFSFMKELPQFIGRFVSRSYIPAINPKSSDINSISNNITSRAAGNITR